MNAPPTESGSAAHEDDEEARLAWIAAEEERIRTALPTAKDDEVRRCDARELAMRVLQEAEWEQHVAECAITGERPGNVQLGSPLTIEPTRERTVAEADALEARRRAARDAAFLAREACQTAAGKWIEAAQAHSNMRMRLGQLDYERSTIVRKREQRAAQTPAARDSSLYDQLVARAAALIGRQPASPD